MNMELSHKINFKYNWQGGHCKNNPDEECLTNKKDLKPLPAEEVIF